MLESDQIENAFTVLTRLAQRQPEHFATLRDIVAHDIPHSLSPAVRVAVATGHPMQNVLEHVARNIESEADLQELLDLLPKDSLVLRRVASIASVKLSTFAQNHSSTPELVLELVNRAESLIEVGVSARALTTALQARALVPEQFDIEMLLVIPDMLRVLSRAYGRCDKHDLAVSTAQEYVRAAEFNFLDAPCYGVAAAHGTLAQRLEAADRVPEALTEFRIAEEMLGKLLKDAHWYVRRIKGPLHVVRTYEESIVVAAARAQNKVRKVGVKRREAVTFVDSDLSSVELRSTLVSMRIAILKLDDNLTVSEYSGESQSILTEVSDLIDSDRDRFLPLQAVASDMLTELARRRSSLEGKQRATDYVDVLRNLNHLSGGAHAVELATALVTRAELEQEADEELGVMISTLDEIVDVYAIAAESEIPPEDTSPLVGACGYLIELSVAAEGIGDGDGAIELARNAVRAARVLEVLGEVDGHGFVRKAFDRLEQMEASSSSTDIGTVLTASGRRDLLVRLGRARQASVEGDLVTAAGIYDQIAPSLDAVFGHDNEITLQAAAEREEIGLRLKTSKPEPGTEFPLTSVFH